MKIRLFTIIAILAFLAAGCSQTVTNNDNSITNLAWEIINRDIKNLESNSAVKIIDSKITRLELMETFDELADYPIQVYALEYRLLPEDLSKVVMAGGMSYDEEGWLRETASMGSPLLVVSDNRGKKELIGTLWTGGIMEDGGMETSIKELLERNALQE
ncbi:MAG: hypothetical protein ACOX3L_06160 [Lutisporaceae bacterium]